MQHQICETPSKSLTRPWAEGLLGKKRRGGLFKKWAVEFLATGFYSGKSKWAPGTAGTLVAVPIAWALSVLHPVQYMVATFAVVIVSVVVAHLYDHFRGLHDCQEIVIDEIAGYLIAMTWLPRTATAFICGFILFRILDAVKPFPISVIDRRIQGGLGVVADDVAAGILTNIVLQIVYVKTDWLGAQWL